MNLVAMVPDIELASSGYALANPAPSGAEYLVYLPEGSTVTKTLNSSGFDRNPEVLWSMNATVKVDLSATPGELNVEWFNPGDGTTIDGGTVSGGSSDQMFTAPFGGKAVLYLYQEGPPVDFLRIYMPVILSH
jgi:hypothetical protein